MTRTTLPSRDEAPAESQPILDAVQRMLGFTPNVIRLLSLSPSALSGFAGLQAALGKTLTQRLRDHIALAVSEVNGCHYCLSAHSHFSARASKLSPDDIRMARRGESTDAREDVAVSFAARLAESRGRVSEAALAAVRTAGFSDAEIVEIVALVAQFSMTNLLNNVFDTDIDFPVVEAPVAKSEARNVA